MMLKAVLFDLGGTLIEEGDGSYFPKAFPYSVKLLTKLKPKFKLAIVCNTTETLDFVREAMNATGILDFFDAVIVSTDVGSRKPEERIFKIALDRLGVKPREAVMVGNRITTDILGGNMAGMKTVLIKWKCKYYEPITSEQEKPSHTIYSLEELIPIIEKNAP